MIKIKPISRQIIDRTIGFVQNFFQKEGTGHDWWHTYRVSKMALRIAREEKADLFITEMAALLHDVGDYKFFGGDEEKGPEIIAEFLDSLQLCPKIGKKIMDIAANISYMKTLSEKENVQEKPKTPEFMAVSDADRLDAMGAIGIARAFTYGGYYHRPIYDPTICANPDISRQEYKTSDAPSVNHFYEKLLKLKDKMYTSYGKKLADGRHRFLEKYLQQFYGEWEGKR